MDLDVERLLGAVERTVTSLERDGKAARAVTLARSYATPVENLWDAVTSAERIPRWFLPVSGRLELGGRYQLEGNAGGTITHCERPSFLGLTWEFGSDLSWVEARMGNDGAGRSRLAVTHTTPVSDHWHKFGPGAVGVGWEMGLLGMELHLTRPDEPRLDGATFHTTRDGKALITGSSAAWGRAAEAAGADPDMARSAAQRTAAFYTGDPVAPD
ncbi:MAG: SRPBCC domain-containing protein [Rhodobacteraceae bacterium]|nr:SRPBCC domain-containing protein [Paracoccaceae bacterium]